MAVPALLGAATRADRRVALERRIWCNRNLNLASIRALGFDMDHTLALYRTARFENLVFREAIERLIQLGGYPAELRRLRFDPDFAIRGLVVDKLRGNVLKMDRNNYVTTAYHGKQRLTREQRKQLYRNQRIDLDDPAFASADTFFSLADIALYGELVQLWVDQGRAPDWARLFEDAHGAVDAVHAAGRLKRRVLARPQRFFLLDRLLPRTLARLRSGGRKLFLLTNSAPDYTAGVMGYLLDRRLRAYPDWRSYFDLVVTDARKPAFFGVGQPLAPGDHPNSFTGGNMKQLESELGCGGDAVLYFGDHTYGDILRSKKSGWRTAMIIGELEHELRLTRGLAARARRLRRLQREITAAEQALRRNSARGTQAGRRRARLAQEWLRLRGRLERQENFIYAAYNPRWGRLFKEFGSLSRFGRQVKTFACIYTSRVSNLLAYPLDHYFAAAEEWMPHELGPAS